MNIVKLEDYEYEDACRVAAGRLARNYGRKDAIYYDNNNKQDEVRANVATCCCEKAVAKYLNLYWHGSIWDVRDHEKYRKLPDVGEDVEVRRIREIKNSVVVRKSDVEYAERIIFVAYAEEKHDFRLVHMLGGISAQLAWEKGEIPSWDSSGKSRYLDQKHLVLP